MGEIIYLSRERIHVTIYTRAWPWGKQGATLTADDQRALAVVNAVVTELGAWYFEVRTRPWLTHFLEAIIHGGWRSPVVVVDLAVYSQGRVPDYADLRAFLTRRLQIVRPRLKKSS